MLDIFGNSWIRTGMPATAKLSARQADIVKACLRISADEPCVFPDWEFSTLFGLERSEVAAVARAWPDVDCGSPVVADAVQNAMNNLLGYPHNWHNEWAAHFDFTEAELAETLAAWIGERPRSYFEALR
jgi:hypothetical protein